ncbi:MAG: phosphatidylglycerol lysyltransferase domain-containing protein [Candidatus Saganbacteria bacterium]|nr:phosphatidylglycerol lysyltransferase domain-containing protein [Candidatus Saganbacteria bacterium]
MLPNYQTLKKLEIDDQKLFQKAADSYNPKICELAFANLIVWQNFDRPEYTFINNNLCVLINPLNESPFFLEPLGKNKLKETIETCFNHCNKLSRLSEDFLFQLDQEKYKINCLRSHSDYVYETKALAELKGKKFDGKRNHIKRFQKQFPDYEFIPLKAEHKDAALELFAEWFKVRQESRFFPKLAEVAQKKALDNAFANFDHLLLKGCALLINKKLKGFIIGSRLNTETYSLHFQYTDPQLHGISQALLWEACNKTFQDSKYVNLEQDLGIPGLRTAKLSYHPHHLERKFEISPLY